MDKEFIEQKVVADINLAKDELESAILMFDSDKYRQAITHAYYAMFHASTALLTKKDIVAKSHEGLIMLMGKEYIKTGIFNKEIFSFLSTARVDRASSSYDSLATFNEDETKEIIEHAKIFIQEAERLL